MSMKLLGHVPTSMRASSPLIKRTNAFAILHLKKVLPWNYDDVIMSAIASQITSLTIVYSIVYSDADQRKHQSSASLAFVMGIHRGPVNSPHKWPVTRKMLPFDDVIVKLKGSKSMSLLSPSNLILMINRFLWRYFDVIPTRSACLYSPSGSSLV